MASSCTLCFGSPVGLISLPQLWLSPPAVVRKILCLWRAAHSAWVSGSEKTLRFKLFCLDPLDLNFSSTVLSQVVASFQVSEGTPVLWWSQLVLARLPASSTVDYKMSVWSWMPTGIILIMVQSYYLIFPNPTPCQQILENLPSQNGDHWCWRNAEMINRLDSAITAGCGVICWSLMAQPQTPTCKWCK